MGLLKYLKRRFSRPHAHMVCAAHTRAFEKGVGPNFKPGDYAALFEQFWAQHAGEDKKALDLAINAHKPPCPVCFEGNEVILNRAIKQVRFAITKGRRG